MLTQKTIIFCILLSCSTCLLQGQEWQFDFTNIADLYKDRGYKNMVITSAAQDKDGLIWLVANEGILRYDGVSIFPFAQQFNDKIIPYTFLYHKMRIASNNDIWLISQSKGVLKIQSDGQKVQPIELPNQGNSIISDIYFESDSIAWFTTSDYKLHQYNLNQNTWQSFTSTLFNDEESDLSFGHMVDNPKNPNQIWIGSKKGILLFDKVSNQFDFYKLEKDYEFYNREWTVPIHLFNEQIFIGAPSSIGIDVFNISKRSFDLRMEHPMPIVGRGFTDVLSFLNYSDSLILVGTYDKNRMGFININPNGEFEYQLKNFNTPNGALEYMQQIIRSEDGSIRAITRRGITRIFQQHNQFNFYKLTNGINSKNNWQRSFLQLDDSDKFLLGTYRGDGLIEVDWKKRRHRMIPYKSKDGILNYDVTMRSLTKDAEGLIWIGSDSGLLACDLKMSNIWQPSKIMAHPVLANSDINFLKYHNSQLLINTVNKGTYIWDFGNDVIVKLKIDNELLIHNMLKTENGWWLGSNAGIKMFDFEKRKISDFQYLDQNVQVMDICRVEDEIWIATKENGLWNLKYAGQSQWKSQKFINSGTYRSNFLHRIVWSSTQNKLWLNTAYGISSFDISKQKYENYTIKDGIGFSRRNSSIFNKLSDGAIIAGANRNFQYFYPDSISKTVTLPNPYMKEIAINGQAVVMNNKGNYVIPKNANHLSFTMGALNMNSNPQNYYSFRLLGIDEEWSNWSSQDFTNYSNLKGGNYTFEFRVSNKLFEWSEVEKITIEIQKKMTETLVFKFFSVVGIVGLFYLFYSFRKKQIKRETDIAANYQKQIAELQMNALQSQMNPHFVFNSINSINYFIIKNDRDQASNYLAKFSRLIRQILENSKSKLITLEQELEAINLYLELEQLRFEGKFSFEIDIDEDVQLLSIQIPPLIIQPYIENAIWHGLMNKQEAGQLLLYIKNFGDQVQCIIEDDGIGRNAAAEINNGKGLHKQSLGTIITKDRLKYIEEMYDIQTNVEIIDLFHMDESAAGTKVIINIPKLKLDHS